MSQEVLTTDQLQDMLGQQFAAPPGKPRKRLGTLVIESGLATERQIAQALADALGLRLVDLAGMVIDPNLARLLPRAVAERNGMIVVARDGRAVTVATNDPTNIVALDDVKLYAGSSDLVLVVATESQIRTHVNRAWSLAGDGTELSTLFEDVTDDDGVDMAASDQVESAPVVQLVDVILAEAVRSRASDVHVEPQSTDLRIRYRVDGLLRDAMTVPRNARAAVISRIKILAGLDIAERRRPQDGRARLAVDGTHVEARVSTLPTMHGEKVVIRVLPRSENVPVLGQIGLTPSQLELVSQTLVQAQGLVLITGPTGSGKTNTLYAAIQQVSTPDRNIVALEDPVEVQVDGISQVQINERQGLSFARGIRSVLRQDPDVVLVGEARDTETAELALQASLTGHLVLTTLHTNDAVSAITRLVDMGVEAFLVASSLTLVVAQRLVRKPCEACASAYVPSPRTLSLLGLSEADLASATPRRGRGCTECGGTGYVGRTGVFEVLPITAALRRVLLTTPTESAVGAAAREHGMSTLRASALAAAHRGETTYEEVLRVTHVDASETPTCPSCARALADDMLVCPWDGTPVARDLCRGCGRQLDAEWHTCPWCRTDVAVPEPAPGRSGSTLRVLVVDDDPAFASFIDSALGRAVEVVRAGDAEQGLAALGSGGVDVALVDDTLPDLAGVEFIRLARSDPYTLTLPIALCTQDATARLTARARQSGADDVLAKPLEPALLEERLLALVSRRTVGSTAPR